MRVKILRRKDTSTVVLVYPSTVSEYRQALETLGRGARPAAGHDELAMGRTESGPPQACYVVTTEEQRRGWGLPDLAARGLARVVNESQALELLHEPAAWSASAELPADAEPDTSGLAAVRGLVAPGPRVDRVLAPLESGVLPPFVCDTLRRAPGGVTGKAREGLPINQPISDRFAPESVLRGPASASTNRSAMNGYVRDHRNSARPRAS